MATTSLGSLLSAIAGAATQGNAIGALIGGFGSLLTPDPAIGLVQNDLLQLQIFLGDPKSVARIANRISDHAGDLTTVAMVANQLAAVAEAPVPDQNAINRGAAALAAVINAASSGSSNLAAFNFLAPTIQATIASKPA